MLLEDFWLPHLQNFLHLRWAVSAREQRRLRQSFAFNEQSQARIHISLQRVQIHQLKMGRQNLPSADEQEKPHC